jgi:hypothetical protein
VQNGVGAPTSEKNMMRSGHQRFKTHSCKVRLALQLPLQCSCFTCVAARTIPNNGKNWIMRDGKQYGRNALIAEEIYRLTGQHRTRQQISSHIQVLKKVHADDPESLYYFNCFLGIAHNISSQ